MSVKQKLRKLIALIGLGIFVDPLTVHAEERKAPGKIYESKYHVAFPLQKGGENIDVLVRTEKTNRAYGFYLIFVEKRNWSWEKKDALNRIYEGRLAKDSGPTPYPIKIHLRIEPEDGMRNNPRIEKIVTERSPRFGRYMNNDTEIWRSQTLHLDGLPAGVYRVRLENLEPVPQIDFETLFAFEKDTRGY